MTLEDRIKKLEAAQAYNERRARRIIEALRSAAGHLVTLSLSASLRDVIDALKSAAGQLMGYTKDGDK
jgi:hypothetical protein